MRLKGLLSSEFREQPIINYSALLPVYCLSNSSRHNLHGLHEVGLSYSRDTDRTFSGRA